MSLLDALLLDPAPFNVWIAYRRDGIKGTGTASDPWDGSPKLATTLSITLTRSGTTATASLSAGHGLQNGDTVVINGATGGDASLWNGTFTISGVGSTSFQYTMASSPASSPASGTITAAKVTGTRFDDVMNGLAGNIKVHLGPTSPGYPFLTAGHSGSSGAWQLKSGMKIIGSGMDVTVLRQFFLTASSAAHYHAISHALGSATRADQAEVSELTIDCNLASAGSSTACGAVRVMGDHVRVRRVKAVNWGTKSSSRPCFVFSLITAAPDDGVPEVVDAGVENCVAVTPASSNNGPVTAFNMGSQDEITFIKEGHAKSPFIRNCYADCGVITPNPAGNYRAISAGWCRGGVVEGNHMHNADIAGPYQDLRGIRDLIVRNNFYKNVARGPHVNLGQLGGTLLSSNASLSVSNGVATISGGGLNVTSLAVGDRVSIVTTSPTTFTGVYQIASVQSSPTVQFTVLTGLTGSATVTSAKKVLSVGRAIIEGNVIELAQVSGAIALSVADNNNGGNYVEPPDYAHGDVIVRNNKIRYVDGAVPNDGGATLIETQGVKNLTVQNNVLDTVATTPLGNKRCGSATYFNNRTPGGVLLRGLNNTTGAKSSELETDAEDAFILGMIRQR